MGKWGASSILRRSGVAVGQITEFLGWKADKVFIVGVGLNHKEAHVMKDGWELGPQDIVGFEPHPGIFKKIDFPGILYKVGMGSTVGKATLYSRRSHKDGSTLYPFKDDANVGVCEVDVSTLDYFLSQGKDGFRPEQLLDQRVLLWLDCEGHELEVLKGAEKFLRHVDVINTEMTMKPSCEGWCDPLELHRYLKKVGFRHQSIHTNRSSAGQSDHIYVRPRLWKREYCCCLDELENDSEF
jgi:FkbM family methyltransferase